jgi:MFS superfamily sulfate permease-like transporter
VLALGFVRGILVGICAALAEVVRRGMYPHRTLLTSAEHQGLYEPFSGAAVTRQGDALVYRFGTAMFFGNAESFLADMKTIARKAPPGLRKVIVNADGLGIPDATAYDALTAADHLLHDRGISLVFGNVRRHTRLAFERGAPLTIIERDELMATVRRIRDAHSSKPMT